MSLFRAVRGPAPWTKAWSGDARPRAPSLGLVPGQCPGKWGCPDHGFFALESESFDFECLPILSPDPILL